MLKPRPRNVDSNHEAKEGKEEEREKYSERDKEKERQGGRAWKVEKEGVGEGEGEGEGRRKRGRERKRKGRRRERPIFQKYVENSKLSKPLIVACGRQATGQDRPPRPSQPQCRCLNKGGSVIKIPYHSAFLHEVAIDNCHPGQLERFTQDLVCFSAADACGTVEEQRNICVGK